MIDPNHVTANSMGEPRLCKSLAAVVVIFNVKWAYKSWYEEGNTVHPLFPIINVRFLSLAPKVIGAQTKP